MLRWRGSLSGGHLMKMIHNAQNWKIYLMALGIETGTSLKQMKHYLELKSTFDEELYTTKLERGPQMRELEKEASRIAGEIEGEETEDLHLAEERGIEFDENFDLDEETRFSSVFRGGDNAIYEENDDRLLDADNNETFGGCSGSIINNSLPDIMRVKSDDGLTLSSCSLLDKDPSSQIAGGLDLSASGSHDGQSMPDCVSKNSHKLDGRNRDQLGGKNCLKGSAERKTVCEKALTSKSEEQQTSLDMKKTSFDEARLSPSATSYSPPSCMSSKGHDYTAGSIGESLVDEECAKPCSQPGNPQLQPGSSTSSTSEHLGAASISSSPRLSSSSSVGSLSSEKSTLNPYAKKFKLNPNAKSFNPSLASLRPPSPVSEGPFYFPTNVSAIPHMHGLPVGIGIGPSFGGHQTVIYNQQAAPLQSHQAYANPNGHMHMILGQPRQVLHMPSYPSGTQYKGRDF